MILQELLDRASQKKPGRMDVASATPAERAQLAEWEKRGWTIRHHDGEIGETVTKMLNAAAIGETDLLFFPGEENLKIVRYIDRALPREYQPISVMQGFEVPTYPKMLWVGFTPMAKYDSIPDAIKGVQTMVKALGELGEEEAKVALLSCVETISPGVHSTIWEATLGHMSQRGQFGKARVDGPLAFDLAVSSHAAQEKGLKSEVGGQADLIIPPDLNSFSTLTDAIHLSGEHRAVGVVVGGPCAIAFTPHRSERHMSLSLAVASLLI